MPTVFELAAQFRRELDQRRSAVSSKLMTAYFAAWERLSAELDRVMEQIGQAQADGTTVSSAWVQRQERFDVLLDQLAAEMTRLANHAAAVTQAEQKRMVELAEDRARRLTEAAARDAGVRIDFNRLPKEALQQFVGMMADGSPLKESFRKLAKDLNVDAAAAIERGITQGLAQGLSPDRIASLIRREIENKGGNPVKDPEILRRLQLATHSSVMWSYRESSRAIYEENSDVLKGWRWLSAKRSNTCPACWALDGKFFPLDTPQGAHPNCKCTLVPVLKDEAEPPESGETKFAKLPEGLQRQILGPAKFAAYKSGDLLLIEDLVAERDNGDWGVQRGTGSLAGAIGDDLAKFYFNGRTRQTFGPLGFGNLYTAEVQMVKRRYETGVVYDADDNIVFRKRGSGTEIVYTDAELKLLAGNTLTHNHPQGKGFSLEDLIFAGDHGLAELRAVTKLPDGKIELHSLKSEDWPNFRWHGTAFSVAAGIAKRVLYLRVLSGELSAEEARRILNQTILEQFVEMYNNGNPSAPLVYRRL